MIHTIDGILHFHAELHVDHTVIFSSRILGLHIVVKYTSYMALKFLILFIFPVRLVNSVY